MLRLVHYMKHDKNSYLNITFITVLFWAIAYSAFEYFMPISLEKNGYSFFAIGILLSSVSFVSIFSDFWFGYLQKSNTKRRLFTYSLLLIVASAMLFIFNQNIILALIALIIYGFGFDLFDVTAYTSVYDNSVENNRSTNISLRDVFETIGVIIGVVLAGLLIKESPQYLIITVVFFLLLAIVTSSQYKNHTKKVEKKVISEFLSDIKLIGFSKGLYSLILISLITFWNGLFFAFEPLFIQNFPNPYINETLLGGLLLATYMMPILFFEYPFGKLEDKLGRKKFAIIGLLIATISMFTLSTSSNIFTLFISTFFISTGLLSMTNPAVNGIYEKFAVKHLGKGKDGDSASFFEFFANLGYVFGPLIGGILIGKIGFSDSFFVIGIIFSLFLILTLFFLKD